MNNNILKREVQQFIQDNIHVPPTGIALKKSPIEGITSAELANQIDGKQRAIHKLPTWYTTDNIYFPDKINLEQCSSERTASFKSKLIPHGSRVVDLTGGFGVDDYFFSRVAHQVTHCELNRKLSLIVKHNFEALHTFNITCLATDGVQYLRDQENEVVDVIYVDPSRRVNSKKVFLLADCEPNIVSLQSLFFEKSRLVISKIAPLLDISHALSSLAFVKAVYVISVDNDCKELLFVQERDYSGPVHIHCIRLFQDLEQHFIFSYDEERNTTNSYSIPLNYLYDPDVCITKAGAFKSLGARYTLGKLHQHTHLYTSAELAPSFPGRVFQILECQRYADFKKSDYPAQANIVVKNSGEKPEAIRKKFKIKDGGDLFLFFTQDLNNNNIVISASRIY
ncbi:class I SAM-dependent methyltransferase [Sphingobacterium sp. SYP-B4668]|uniref:class I SAM-dependent methyltransferase n=1 Tax=Sphingobacterium sp. SYP-B4668 TaxID=2996035 RepID=UPI0022DD0DF6|nr:class I SAM-dependent methyltransferase [Sphingobacterium sp. SYP-B4668]